MDRRSKGRALAGAVLVSCLYCGCVPVAMTIAAGNSPGPVMFGPVKTLGAGGAMSERSGAPGGTPLHHEEHAGVLSVYPGIDFHYASTNAVRGGEGPVSSTKAAMVRNERAWLDWKVREATGGNPARRVDVTSIRCGGFFSVDLLAIVVNSSCALDGFVSNAR